MPSCCCSTFLCLSSLSLAEPPISSPSSNSTPNKTSSGLPAPSTVLIKKEAKESQEPAASARAACEARAGGRAAARPAVAPRQPSKPPMGLREAFREASRVATAEPSSPFHREGRRAGVMQEDKKGSPAETGGARGGGALNPREIPHAPPHGPLRATREVPRPPTAPGACARAAGDVVPPRRV